MAECIADQDNQSLNHLISDGKWDYQQVMDQVGKRTNTFFQASGLPDQDIALIVDEVGFSKKGKYSACVSRQWLGCLGKQDNGQVAVGLVASCQHYYSPIDMRLFMPQNWSEDHQRRKKAKIPDRITYQSKPDIALEMIEKAINNGFKFSWVGFDALYGMNYKLLKTLDQMEVTFMADIRSDARIFFERPNLVVPEKKPGSRGRKPTKPKPDQPDFQVKAYVEGLTEQDWTLVKFRDGTKKPLQALFHRKVVWIYDEALADFLCYTLVVRKDSEGIKYSLTNCMADIERLAYMQGQRYFVEKSYKEGKNQVGMGDYQVRSWEGFHRHMALSMLALNFIMEQKKKLKKELPHITAEDIRKMIAIMIPDKHTSIGSLWEEIRLKHKYYRKQIWKAKFKYAM